MNGAPPAGQTRRSLHAVAELVLAAAQYARSGTIRLRASSDRIRTVAEPRLTMTSTGVEGPTGHTAYDGHTPRSLAAALGVDAGSLSSVFPDGSGLGLDDALEVDATEAEHVLAALGLGDEALRAFAPEVEPVLWPEHFDTGISVDEVNYGVSAGDGYIASPYAYVGPWQVPAADDFWNAPFGAARELASLGGADAVRAFFEDGKARAAALRT